MIICSSAMQMFRQACQKHASEDANRFTHESDSFQVTPEDCDWFVRQHLPQYVSAYNAVSKHCLTSLDSAEPDAFSEVLTIPFLNISRSHTLKS